MAKKKTQPTDTDPPQTSAPFKANPSEYTLELPCKLDDSQRLQKALEREDLNRQAETIKVNRKALMSSMARDADRILGEAAEIGAMVSTGIEYRDVVCKEVKNFDRREVEIFRQDTGERVKTRALKGHELQDSLPLGVVGTIGPRALAPEESKRMATLQAKALKDNGLKDEAELKELEGLIFRDEASRPKFAEVDERNVVGDRE